jgi:hypothetical protein
LVHEAGHGRGLPDRRHVRTFRQLVLGVLLKQSTRLLALGQVVAPSRRVQSVNAAAMALGYFLAKAQVPLRPLALRLGEAALRSLDPAQFVTYQGKVLLVIDPTEYAKHSRGKGTRGRHMQSIGRVRQTKGTLRPPQRKKQGVSSAARPRPLAPSISGPASSCAASASSPWRVSSSGIGILTCAVRTGSRKRCWGRRSRCCAVWASRRSWWGIAASRRKEVIVHLAHAR